MAERPLLASEIFACSQNCKCHGTQECHWCGGPCQLGKYLWEGPPREIGVKVTELAVRPGNGFFCVGCWLWRRGRVTVEFLAGGWKDVQKAEDFGWYVTMESARALRPGNPYDLAVLRDILTGGKGLPRRFFLALRGESTSPKTHLQCCKTNDLVTMKADSELVFTKDNIPHTFSVYELTEAVRKTSQGKPHGVRVLAEVLKLANPLVPDIAKPLLEKVEGSKEGKKSGRPPMENDRRRVIHSSGQKLEEPPPPAGRRVQASA